MTALISLKLTPGTSSWSFLSSGDEIGREDVAAGRGDLSELDERRPEVLKDEPRAFGQRDARLLRFAVLELLVGDLRRVRRRVGLLRPAEPCARDDLAEAVANEDGGDLAEAAEIADCGEDADHRSARCIYDPTTGRAGRSSTSVIPASSPATARSRSTPETSGGPSRVPWIRRGSARRGSPDPARERKCWARVSRPRPEDGSAGAGRPTPPEGGSAGRRSPDPARGRTEGLQEKHGEYLWRSILWPVNWLRRAS